MDVRLPLSGSPVEERWRWSSPFLERYPQFHIWMGKALFWRALEFSPIRNSGGAFGSSLWVMPSAWQLVVRPFELLSTLDSILSVSGYNILQSEQIVKRFLCEIYLKFSEAVNWPDKLQTRL